jgi:hypothetical protein
LLTQIIVFPLIPDFEATKLTTLMIILWQTGSSPLGTILGELQRYDESLFFSRMALLIEFLEYMDWL